MVPSRGMAILLKIILVLLLKHIDEISSTEFEKRCHDLNFTNLDENGCPDIQFCKKSFNLSYIDMPPYTPTNIIEKLINICCRNCSKHSIKKIFNNISEVHMPAISSLDIVFPVLGSINENWLTGYYFLPIMHVPQAYYITVMSKITLFRSIFHLYPLITICVLMALVSGFFCWIMETWANTEEFPREFPIGWFEGFWWSFVSMTTVGYGDKSPRTFVGRLFSVVWIFTGITVCGILTALLTTRIMEANTPKIPDMTGDNIGVLKYRYYEALLVSHHGGLIHEAEAKGFKPAVYELIYKLRTQQIHGILLDRYTLWDLIANFTKEMEQKHDHVETNFFMKETVISSRIYSHEVLAYGVLVKDKYDYDFLREVISTNRFVIQTELTLAWNNLKKDFFHRHTRGLFSADQEYYQTSVIVLCGTIVMICVFGSIYEYMRRSSLAQKTYMLTKGDNSVSEMM